MSSTDQDTVEVKLGNRVVTVPKGGLYDRYRMNTDLDEVTSDPRVSDVDFYTEAAVGVAVRPARHGGPGFLDLLTGLGNDHLHTYVLSLPVNTDIAQVRGHDGYGFPKWVTQLDVDIDERPRGLPMPTAKPTSPPKLSSPCTYRCPSQSRQYRALHQNESKAMNTNALKDGSAKLMNLAHRLVLTISGKRLLAKPFGMPLVELHTTGRKSGQPRSCYLTTPVHDANRIVLVASKGGDDRNPDWYQNLRAHPDAELVINGERRKVHARTASADEKAELWPKIIAAYKGYANYQKRTTRDIPVVICELQG